MYLSSSGSHIVLPKRWAARNDRDLVERLGVLEQFEQQGVTGFVIGGVRLFLLAQGQAAAFLAPAHFVARFFEFGQGDAFQIRGARRASAASLMTLASSAPE